MSSAIQEAREDVIQAGKQLVKKGLIARTWGNVSCRISASEFVITPSGIGYENLKPEEIVIVNIEDCGYTGDVEPSSEKGVHAEVYKQRPDVNFVIHTHQPCASAVSTLKTNIDIAAINPDLRHLIGDQVIYVPYGLPGSTQLRKNVATALAHSGSKAYLLASHGTLCLGADCDEAFRVALAMEELCTLFIEERYCQLSGRSAKDYDHLRDYFVKSQTGGLERSGESVKIIEAFEVDKEDETEETDPMVVRLSQSGQRRRASQHLQYLFSSERVGNYFKLYLDAGEDEPFPQVSDNIFEVNLEKGNSAISDSSTCFEKKQILAVEIHRAVYNSFENVNIIRHTISPDIRAVSKAGKDIYPLLDDCAQIIGPSVKVADLAADRPEKLARVVVENLQGRSALLIKNNGALCCGPNKSDAEAAAMVLDKNCKAIIAAALFGQVEPIAPEECALLRNIYLEDYSKKAERK